MPDEHDVNYLSGKVDALQADLEAVKVEVHQIGVSVAEMRAELRALARRQSPGEIVYAFLMFGAAGAGLWFDKIPPWMAGAGVLAGAILSQRGRLDRLVSNYFSRRNGNGSGE
jgi:hypothetical protein